MLPTFFYSSYSQTQHLAGFPPVGYNTSIRRTKTLRYQQMNFHFGYVPRMKPASLKGRDPAQTSSDNSIYSPIHSYSSSSSHSWRYELEPHFRKASYRYDHFQIARCEHYSMTLLESNGKLALS